MKVRELLEKIKSTVEENGNTSLERYMKEVKWDVFIKIGNFSYPISKVIFERGNYYYMQDSIHFVIERRKTNEK